MAPGQVWEVKGGGTSGGIVVRVGKDTKSEEHPSGRLAKGSLVVELESDEERLHYTLMTGEGPLDGWVSFKFKDNVLLLAAGEKGTKFHKEKRAAKKAREELKAEGARVVWLIPMGTRGDVQPMVALGVALRNNGYFVRMLTGADGKDFCESFGLNFSELGLNTANAMKEEREKQKDLMASGSDADTDELFNEYKEDPQKMGNDQLERWYASEERIKTNARQFVETMEQNEKPDLIIAHPLAGKIPLIAKDAIFAEMSYCPEMLVNLSTLQEDLTLLIESDQARWIKEEVGVDIAEGWTVERYRDLKVNRHLCFASQRLFEAQPAFVEMFKEMDPSADVMSHEYVRCARERCVGWLFLDPALQTKDLSSFGGIETLAKLHNFIEAGSKPVYIGWGSMPVPIFVLAKLIVCLRMLKLRAIVCEGWGGINFAAIKEYVDQYMPKDEMGLIDYCKSNILFVGPAPHEWLFRRCAVLIHHGGAGTTSAALRSRVPMIITPFLVDQFYFADWVTNMGVGGKLNLRENPEKVMDPVWSKTLRFVATDKTLRAKAEEVGAEIAAEPSVEVSLARIRDLLGEKAASKKAEAEEE